MPASTTSTQARTGQQRPQVIAHRGLSSRFPENTMPAYEAAIAAGADMVELDFYSTLDGMLVCIHDAKLNRYLASDAPPGLADRPICSFTLAELEAVDVGSWKDPGFKGARIPTLDEVLGRFMLADGKTASLPTLVLEQKEGTPDQLLTLLKRYNALEKVIVQSFNWDFVRGMHVLEPCVHLAALGGGPLTDRLLREMLSTGATTLHWDQQTLTLESIRQAHALGLKVWSYTLNNEVAWRGAQVMGLDAITTDFCDKALAVYNAG